MRLARVLDSQRAHGYSPVKGDEYAVVQSPRISINASHLLRILLISQIPAHTPHHTR